MKLHYDSLLFLLFIALQPCQAEVSATPTHEYDGTLNIETVSGQSCPVDMLGERYFAMTWREIAEGGIDGYVMGTDLLTGRLLGRQLEALTITYPTDEFLVREHSLSAAIQLDGRITGSLHEKPSIVDDGACYITSATFNLKSNQNIMPNLWQNASISFLSSLAKKQTKQYGEAVLPVQQMLTILE